MIAGLATILERSATAFEIVRVAGVVYLAILGLGVLRQAARTEPKVDASSGSVQTRTRRPSDGYRSGLLTNLTNPKTLLFFAGLLPQFVPDTASTIHLVGLGLTVVLVSTAWYSALALTAVAASTRLERQSIRRTIDAILGATLLIVAGRLALASRS